MMDEPNEVKSQPAVLHMTVQVTRKATGKVEEYQLTGTGLTVEDCERAGIQQAAPAAKED
jgi:ribosomal protein L13E